MKLIKLVFYFNLKNETVSTGDTAISLHIPVFHEELKFWGGGILLEVPKSSMRTTISGEGGYSLSRIPYSV